MQTFKRAHGVNLAMFLLALIGLFVSLYLLYAYVTHIPIACGVSAGCETVRLSKWAYSLGLPRPLWGVGFYVGVMTLLILKTIVESDRYRLWLRIGMYLAVIIGVIESVFLFLVQWLDIRAFCVWCLASALVTIALAVLVIFDKQKTVDEESLKIYGLVFSLYVPVVLMSLWWLIG